MERLRAERLKRLLLHAIRHVPAYRRCGVSAAAITESPFNALREFPILEKKSLRDNLVDYVSDDFDAARAFKVSTSGSTGVPLVLVEDEDSLVEYSAVYYRVFEEFGILPGSRLAQIIADAARATHSVETQLFAGLCEISQPNLLGPDSRPRAAAIDYLCSVQPTAVFGNPSDLLLLASEISRRKDKLTALKVAISCGENLSPAGREMIEISLGCKVAEVYSMQECKAIAWECASGTLHVNDDRVVIEELPAPSGDHEIIITNLCNLSMPLVRYRTHDHAEISRCTDHRCRCGRALNSLRQFQGRDRGFIVSPDGRYFSPRAIKLLLTEAPVASWQLTQRETKSVTVRFCARDGQSVADVVAQLRPRMTDLLEGQIAVEFESVPLWELHQGEGKFQMMKLTAYHEQGYRM